MKKLMLVALFLACIVVSCASPTPLPSPSSTPLPTNTPTLMPTPTATQVPMIDVNGIQVPDPKVSNPELFDVYSADSPIVQFRDAMSEVGITVDTQQVITQLEAPQNFKVIKGVDAKTYILTTYTVTDQNSTSYMVGYIAEQGSNGKWIWKEASLQDSKDIKFMTAVDLGDSNHVDPQYNLTARNNFSGIVISGGLSAIWINKYPPYDYANMMNGNYPTLTNTRISIFWHQDIPSNEAQNPNFMQDRIQQIIPWIKKMSNGGKNKIILNVANEAMWYFNGHTGFQTGYPFFTKYQEGWIKEATIELIKALKTANIPLDNITFEIDNEYGIEIPQPEDIAKANFVLKSISQIANEVQQSFPNEQLNTTTTFHITTTF